MKLMIFSLSGLLVLGGVFSFIFKSGLLNSATVLIIIVFVLLLIAIVIGTIMASRKKQEQSRDIISKINTDLTPVTKIKQDTCYFCDFPIENYGEFCSNCGNKIAYCTVCKLPISFGDKVGKCKICETKGHFSHLFEWVKINGSCPHCLQKIPLEAIIEIN